MCKALGLITCDIRQETSWEEAGASQQRAREDSRDEILQAHIQNCQWKPSVGTSHDVNRLGGRGTSPYLSSVTLESQAAEPPDVAAELRTHDL